MSAVLEDYHAASRSAPPAAPAAGPSRWSAASSCAYAPACGTSGTCCSTTAAPAGWATPPACTRSPPRCPPSGAAARRSSELAPGRQLRHQRRALHRGRSAHRRLHRRPGRAAVQGRRGLAGARGGLPPRRRLRHARLFGRTSERRAVQRQRRHAGRACSASCCATMNRSRPAPANYRGSSTRSTARPAAPGIKYLPGVTTTLVCPSCQTVLDAAGPQAQVLAKGERSNGVRTTLPLGAHGQDQQRATGS